MTPMMQQYLEIKNRYPDTIVLFRLGDFYEVFFEDAKEVARVLGIVLTGRESGSLGKVPMCGFPHHAAESYFSRLVTSGFRIAICEQLEDPKSTRELVRRDVVRIITPGTLTDFNFLHEKNNNFLLALTQQGRGKKRSIGLAFFDFSTGDFFATELIGPEANEKAHSEILRISPTEILLVVDDWDQTLIESIKNLKGTSLHDYTQLQTLSVRTANEILCGALSVNTIENLGFTQSGAAVLAAAGLLQYIQETQRIMPSLSRRLKPYYVDQYLIIDEFSRRNLEIMSNIRTGEKAGSLLGIIDRTITAMGGRKLRQWLDRPLLDRNLIEARLNAVEEFVNNFFLRVKLRELLCPICDLERLLSRVTYGTGNPRDLTAIKESLTQLSKLKQLLAVTNTSSRIRTLLEHIIDLAELVGFLETALVPEPSAGLRDGGIIKEGFDPEVDRLRALKQGGKEWIADYEVQERKRTGIKNLKIRFNKIFGYFIEITKTNLNNTPENYIRKQTLANVERFYTPELKEFELQVLAAQDQLIKLEYAVFLRIRDAVAENASKISTNAEIVAELDILASFADLATERAYCKPLITQGSELFIQDARHPVVESLLAFGNYVPNDIEMDGTNETIHLITGPNMGGKSTFCRSITLICIMAQIGSFVPAKFARIGIVDRVFARIGASDDLASGQSTFMVEMNEVASILHTATAQSLIVLDEVGRGTGTIDGLSIAWALVEYIHDQIQARTLFATHYHELTSLSIHLQKMRNYCFPIQEDKAGLIFLRRIQKGAADKSYGLQVAKLAGLPQAILNRADIIMNNLAADKYRTDSFQEQKSSQTVRKAQKSRTKTEDQLELF